MWLALDQGSTSSGAAAIDDAGRIRALERVKYTTRRPEPGHVETSADDIVRSILRAADSLRSRRRFEGVGLGAQRSTIVLWDRRTGKAVAPALSWQDLRAAKTLGRLGLDAAEIHRRTGLISSAHYSAVKMKWLLENVRFAQQRARDGRSSWEPTGV